MSAVQARIDRVRWYHDFDFGGGLHAVSCIENADAVRRIWRFIETELDTLEFRGKSVLDIGAWDGYWSFYAERRGAASVLATDDRTQNWAGSEGLALARELLGSAIEVRQDLPIYELATLGRRFDVILCLGVFYHLRDPFYGFAQIRHCCHPGTVVIVEGDLGWTGLAAHEVRYFHLPWVETLLSASALDALLRSAYLEPRSRVWLHPFASAPDETGPVQSDRALTICTPFTSANDLYLYRPHFGLHVYDDRFR